MDLERTDKGVYITHFEIPESFIDQYNHVNYKRYAEIAEIGQDEYLASRGLSFEYIEKYYGLRSFVISFDQVNFNQLFLGDKLDLLTGIEKFGNTSMSFGQSAFKEDNRIFDFNLKVVLVNAEGKPTRIPNSIREQLLMV